MSESNQRAANAGPPNPDLALTLRNLAALAEQGMIAAIAVTGTTRDGKGFTAVHDDPSTRMAIIGGLTAISVSLSNALISGGARPAQGATQGGQA